MELCFTKYFQRIIDVFLGDGSSFLGALILQGVYVIHLFRGFNLLFSWKILNYLGFCVQDGLQDSKRPYLYSFFL